MHSQSSLSKNDQLIDAPGRFPSFESAAVEVIFEELWLHFRPSILAYPVQIGLQTAYDSLVLQEAISYGISPQIVLMEELYLLEQPDPLAIQGDRRCIDAQKESFLFLNKAPALQLSSDSIFCFLRTSPPVFPYWYERVMNVSQNFLCQRDKF